MTSTLYINESDRNGFASNPSMHRRPSGESFKFTSVLSTLEQMDEDSGAQGVPNSFQSSDGRLLPLHTRDFKAGRRESESDSPIKTTDIPMYERKASYNNPRKGSVSSSHSFKVQMLPNAESLGLMMDKNFEGDDLFSPGRTYRKLSTASYESSTFGSPPLLIPRKKPPSTESLRGIVSDAEIESTSPKLFPKKASFDANVLPSPQLSPTTVFFTNGSPFSSSRRPSHTVPSQDQPAPEPAAVDFPKTASVSPAASPPRGAQALRRSSTEEGERVRQQIQQGSWVIQPIPPFKPKGKEARHDQQPNDNSRGGAEGLRYATRGLLNEKIFERAVPAAPVIVLPPGDDDSPEAALPAFCPMEDEPDIPGVMPQQRRGSHFSDTTDSGSETSLGEDEDDDFEDDDDDRDGMHNFALEDFPVPSKVIGTPKAQMPSDGDATSRPSGSGSIQASTVTQDTSETTEVKLPQRNFGIRVKSLTTVRSSPRPDLFNMESGPSVASDWDLSEELEIRDRVFRAEMKAPSKADKLRRRQLRKQFDQFRAPEPKDLYEASLLSVRDEYGNRIRFGSLFEGQRTIVCFIRHFWCSLCQDYVDSIARVKPAILEKYGMKLIVISNGSWKMIKGYKKMLGDRCPYPIYTDRGKYVYTALGMTLRTFSAGKASEKGKYIQRSMTGNILQGIVSGLQLPMKPPGDQQQLGGEFILGPGLQCKFSHRMKSTRGHAEIDDVLAAVDIDLARESEALAPTPMVMTPRMAYIRPESSVSSIVPTNSAAPSTPRLSTAQAATNTPKKLKKTRNGGILPNEFLTPPGSPALGDGGSLTPKQRRQISILGRKRNSQVPTIPERPPRSPLSMDFGTFVTPSHPSPAPSEREDHTTPKVATQAQPEGPTSPSSQSLIASSSRFSSSSEDSRVSRRRGGVVHSFIGHLRPPSKLSHRNSSNASINGGTSSAREPSQKRTSAPANSQAVSSAHGSITHRRSGSTPSHRSSRQDSG